jgi:hypothetical protein
LPIDFDRKIELGPFANVADIHIAADRLRGNLPPGRIERMELDGVGRVDFQHRRLRVVPADMALVRVKRVTPSRSLDHLEIA